MIPINLSGFTANPSSPKYDPLFPAGNRPGGGVTLMGEANFAVHGLNPPSTYPNTSWSVGHFGDGLTVIEDGWVKQFWPANQSGGLNWVNFNLPPDCSTIGVTFKTKMSAGIALKFCKIFGIQHPAEEGRGYANSTFQMGNGGNMAQVSFGDGSGANIDNDVGSVVNLDGSFPDWVGRSYGMPGNVVSTPQNIAPFFGDGQEHFMELIYGQNTGTSSGNEINDGRIFLRVDGLVYADCTGLFNKYPTNDKLWYLALGNYAQGNPIDAFVYFKDVKVYLGGLPS